MKKERLMQNRVTAVIKVRKGGQAMIKKDGVSNRQERLIL
jgi:hypothetical protein